MADAIDKALEFIEKTKRLGSQLERASEQQKLYISQLKRLYKEGKESSDEYTRLSRYSEELQAMIEKWSPVYKERLKKIGEAKAANKKRS